MAPPPGPAAHVPARGAAAPLAQPHQRHGHDVNEQYVEHHVRGPLQPTSPVGAHQSPSSPVRQSPRLNAASPQPSYGLGNLGAGEQDARRRKQEEVKRALEEQIAEKERQREAQRRPDPSAAPGRASPINPGPVPLRANAGAALPPQEYAREDLNPREARLQNRALERLREKEREVQQAEDTARQMPEGSDERADMLRHALQLRVDFERAQARNPELRQMMQAPAPGIVHQDDRSQIRAAHYPGEGHGAQYGAHGAGGFPAGPDPWPHGVPERAVPQAVAHAQVPQVALPGHYQHQQPYTPAQGAYSDVIHQAPHGVSPLEAHQHMLGIPALPGAMQVIPTMPASQMHHVHQLHQPPGVADHMQVLGMPPGAFVPSPQVLPSAVQPVQPAQPVQPGVPQVFGVNNMGAGDEQRALEARRRKQEEMRRALEEQIAQKERQKKEEQEQRRQEEQLQLQHQQLVQMAPTSPMQAGPNHDMTNVAHVAGTPYPPVGGGPAQPAPNDALMKNAGRLGPEDVALEQRRKKQEEMKRALAEQIAEKERQKKEEEEQRRLEDERENERIRREQAAEEARLEARRLEDEARQKALHQQNERAAAERRNEIEDDEPPGPLPKPMGRASRSTRDQNQGQVGQRSDLFGLPQPSAASPLPWEGNSAPAQSSGNSFCPAPMAQGSFHGTLGSGPQSVPNAAPVSDMLQGLMYQQQELYRHQQEALARLQGEADRLRQEKEIAKQDLLDMKAKQLEEKEKDVKKLQRKLQRQMLLQGNTAQLQPLESMLPSEASTPKDVSGMQQSETPWRGEFYSKYEQPPAQHEPSQTGQSVNPAAETSGYPSDEDFQRLRRESNNPSTWPVAPVPWLQPETEGDLPIISSAPEAPPGSIGASLFEDSWGKPLEDTQKSGSHGRASAASKAASKAGRSLPLSEGFGQVTSATSAMEGTLVGESKLVDPQGCTIGATWKASTKGGPTFDPSNESYKSLKQDYESYVPSRRDASSLGSTSKLLESLEAKNDEDTADPLMLLQGAVKSMREARAEGGECHALSLSNSAFLSKERRGTSSVDASDPVDDVLQFQPASEWGNVCRHFGAESTPSSRPEASEPTHRPSPDGEFHNRLTCDFEGFPQYPRQGRLDLTDRNSVLGEKQEAGEATAPDSLDLLQNVQDYRASNGIAMAGSNASSLLGLGTQRPIAKDDFAALAAATPEDFDAFLARLKGQDGQSLGQSARGRSPQVSGMSVKERAKFGSPTLRAAAGSLLGASERAPSGHSGRPESGSSATSLNSGGAPGALRDLRNQRRKPKTAEDLLVHGSDLTVPGPAQAGPGTSLHATVPAALHQEASVLQSLRAEKKHQETVG
ncbi:unnamed protein product [Durusdinium trenchii]|uniref:Uncharacterized protein n=1 Tax=Durusdinium trenchii TaxID=1381693 RepID=A0ABP0NWN8_9DINO